MPSELNRVMTDPRNITAKAAALVVGNRYSELLRLCEDQKTISTKKLESFIERFHEEDKLFSIQLREIALALSTPKAS